MKLPLFAPREERVPTHVLEQRAPLAHAIALVDAGNPEALAEFADALGCDVIHVTEGPFELDDRAARVDATSMDAFAQALGERPVALVGAIVPALFRPLCTVAFALGPSPATFPPAARAVREALDAILSSGRPGVARNFAETRLRRA